MESDGNDDKVHRAGNQGLSLAGIKFSGRQSVVRRSNVARSYRGIRSVMIVVIADSGRRDDDSACSEER